MSASRPGCTRTDSIVATSSGSAQFTQEDRDELPAVADRVARGRD